MERTFKLADGKDLLQFLRTAKQGEQVELVSNAGDKIEVKFYAYISPYKDRCSYGIFSNGITPLIMRYNFQFSYLLFIEDEKLVANIMKNMNDSIFQQRILVEKAKIKSETERFFGEYYAKHFMVPGTSSAVQEKSKKNVKPFVLALIGAVFGLIGGIIWAVIADAINTVSKGEVGAYLACYIIFGIGGAAIALVGGILAFINKKGGFAVTVAGLLCQVAMLIAACVGAEGFSFLLNLCTLVSIIMLVIASIFAFKKS